MLSHSSLLTDMLNAAEAAKLGFIESVAKVTDPPTFEQVCDNEYMRGLSYGLDIAYNMVAIKYPINGEPSQN